MARNVKQLAALGQAESASGALLLMKIVIDDSALTMTPVCPNNPSSAARRIARSTKPETKRLAEYPS
jgi:hypothetical protein